MEQLLHIIFGTGPVGCWTARALREHGIPVKAVNRSGKRPALMPVDVEVLAADVSVPDLAVKAAEGASVVYQAANPEYHQWQLLFPGLQTGALQAARAVGARYVSIENLYMYDSSSPINEDSRIAPRSKKGELRARMAEEVVRAHTRGDLRTAVLRSSDYYGPGVLGSAFGERSVGPLLAGKKAQVLGDADTLHSYAYIEDVGRAAAILGTSEEAFGKVWITPHAPPLTQRAMVERTCQLIGREPSFSVISPLMMRMAGLFVPGARASVEMMYEFLEPFVVDSTRMETTFGLTPTPVDVGLQRTVEWYRDHFGR